VSSAGAVSPPPGTPGLADMALRATDFPGSVVAKQGYVKPDDLFIASYERAFKPLSVRVGPKRLYELESDVDLTASPAAAHGFMRLIPRALALIDQEQLSSSFGSAFTYLKLGKIRSVRAGNEALELAIRLGTPSGEIRLVFVYMRVDRVIHVILMMGAPRAAIGIADATKLAGLAAAHTREAFSPRDTAPPTVSGTPEVGQTLTAAPGTWSNAPTAFAYSWQRCDSAGANCTDTGSTGLTYTVTAADTGTTLRVEVTATNAFGPTRATSSVTVPVAGPPAASAPPAISGSASVGGVLTATTGTWAGSPTSFAYQWQRCDAAGLSCTAIDGATASAYTVDAADSGSTLRVAVTASNSHGSATAVSAQTAVVG
jgi:hypothetical protein